MTITVQMLQTRKGQAGADLLVGQTYDIANDLAIQLVGNKMATDVHNVIALAKDANANTALAATPTQVAALALAGTAVPAGTLLRNSATSVVYGQSDGVGGYQVFGEAATPAVMSYPIPGAGTYLAALGQLTFLGVFLDSSVVGTVVVKDSIEGTLGPTIMNQATIAESNKLYTSGAPPVYTAVYSGLHVVVTGANVGKLLFSAREA